jgi:hypothetical protein
MISPMVWRMSCPIVAPRRAHAQHGTEPLCICLDYAPHILQAYDDGLQW